MLTGRPFNWLRSSSPDQSARENFKIKRDSSSVSIGCRRGRRPGRHFSRHFGCLSPQIDREKSTLSVFSSNVRHNSTRLNSNRRAKSTKASSSIKLISNCCCRCGSVCFVAINTNVAPFLNTKCKWHDDRRRLTVCLYMATTWSAISARPEVASGRQTRINWAPAPTADCAA